MQTFSTSVFSWTLGLSMLPTYAFSEASEQRLANLLALSEAALTTTVMLRERFPDQTPNIFWAATFNDTTWTLHISNTEARKSINNSPMIADWTTSGSPFDPRMTTVPVTNLAGEEPSKLGMTFDGQVWMPLMSVQIHGILSNTEGPIDISFIGGGGFGPEPIYVSGKSVFENYNGHDHGQMEFSQTVKIGEHSWWGWIRGAELIVGGAVGAAGGVLATGATAGAAAVIGLSAAIAGSSSAASISDVAAEYFDTSESGQPSLPVTPSLPNISAETLVADLTDDYVVVEAALGTGSLIGSFPNGPEMTGTFDLEDGIGSGEIK